VATGSTPARGKMAIAEMKEFAGFPPSTQRYIRRSLDIAFERNDPVSTWSRDIVEQASIKVQLRYYERIPEIRDRIPENSGLDWVEPFMAPLVAVSAFDLAQDRLPTFSAYRFLYERLIGGAARPWFVGAFCAAASLPHISPTKRYDLLTSISEHAATAAGWSARDPSFYPAWVDKAEDGSADDEDDTPSLN